MNYELIAICDHTRGLKMRSLTLPTSLLRDQVEKFLKKGMMSKKKNQHTHVRSLLCFFPMHLDPERIGRNVPANPSAFEQKLASTEVQASTIKK